jgi:hypothetical protein
LQLDGRGLLKTTGLEATEEELGEVHAIRAVSDLISVTLSDTCLPPARAMVSGSEIPTGSLEAYKLSLVHVNTFLQSAALCFQEQISC